MRGLKLYLVSAERSVDEERPQERSSDADRNNTVDVFASGTLPLAVAHAVGKVLDFVQHFPHLRNNILAVSNHLLLAPPTATAYTTPPSQKRPSVPLESPLLPELRLHAWLGVKQLGACSIDISQKRL